MSYHAVKVICIMLKNLLYRMLTIEKKMGPVNGKYHSYKFNCISLKFLYLQLLSSWSPVECSFPPQFHLLQQFAVETNALKLCSPHCTLFLLVKIVLEFLSIWKNLDHQSGIDWCVRENPVSCRKPRFRGQRVWKQVKVIQIPMTKVDLFLRIFEGITLM